MLVRILVGLTTLVIILANHSPSDEISLIEETWVLTEVREKESNNTVQIPLGEFIKLSFHGESCITINTKCVTNTGIYITQTSYLRKNQLVDFVIPRAMFEVHRECSTDFFSNEVERFSDVIAINRRESNLLEVITQEYFLSFSRGDSSQPLSCIDRCSLVPNGGICRAMHVKFYFDQEEQKCKRFNWGGCDGIVPFETLEECKAKCGY